MSAHPGRDVSYEYRVNRAILLAVDDTCHLCGHPGARTADHVIPHSLWPAGQPGVDSLANLAPAHGSMGPYRPPNRCPTCKQLCNQSKKDHVTAPVESRRWAGPPPPARPQSRDW